MTFLRTLTRLEEIINHFKSLVKIELYQSVGLLINLLNDEEHTQSLNCGYNTCESFDFEPKHYQPLCNE